MRRDARGCRPLSSERGGGKTGSAAQNLPRFSSTATTVLDDLRADWPLEPPEDLAGLPEALPGFPTGLPGLPEDLPDLTGLPADFLPLDPRGELT
jgi:hypothetical protein